MDIKWDTVELLRHSRHDWLNKLQLIKGNLALERYERVNDLIEEIVIDARNEGKLSSLNMPDFAAYLMTYNWRENIIKVDFEVLGDERDLSNCEEDILKWCKAFFHLLKESVVPHGENHVSLSMEIGEGCVDYYFDIQADWADREQFETKLQALETSKELQCNNYSLHHNECTIELQMNC
ncbi:Spo0B C-terminal domain-containing protein [Bacillus tianshenii]|nr:Spo0B C-terminal domain-containing protein [Bacillus tianshenii]